MNIKTLINPLIFGREGINDNTWKMKFTGGNGSTGFNIRCKNVFLFKTKTGIEKVRGFCIALSVSGNGEVKFNKIALVGKVNDQLQRLIVIDDIRKLFIELIEDKLTGND